MGKKKTAVAVVNHRSLVLLHAVTFTQEALLQCGSRMHHGTGVCSHVHVPALVFVLILSYRI